MKANLVWQYPENVLYHCPECNHYWKGVYGGYKKNCPKCNVELEINSSNKKNKELYYQYIREGHKAVMVY